MEAQIIFPQSFIESLQLAIAPIVERSVSLALKELPLQPPQPKEDASLSREQTARKLGVSYPTLRKLEQSGKLRPFRVGRSVKYRLLEVDRFMGSGGL